VILAEIGTDMTRFANSAQPANWAGMCPGNRESAGRRKSRKTHKGSKWLRSALIESGNAAARSKSTAVGARYHRLVRHLGHRKAVVAIGRQILEISYHLLAANTTYREVGVDYFDRNHADRVRRRCIRQLEHLNDQVILSLNQMRPNPTFTF
jgi:transposase